MVSDIEAGSYEPCQRPDSQSRNGYIFCRQINEPYFYTAINISGDLLLISIINNYVFWTTQFRKEYKTKSNHLNNRDTKLNATKGVKK